MSLRDSVCWAPRPRPIVAAKAATPRRRWCVWPHQNKMRASRSRVGEKLTGVLLLGACGLASADKAKAGLVEDFLAKAITNKELNDRKRLATSLYVNTCLSVCDPAASFQEA
ncbi:hypothetical protein L7F22_025576 [Adiantum nelumboides]|nr:hypothetical protein [Adiantum nelumboides]MCO5571828.1 hypothetical protein [Adiantum nelumboides]